MNYFAEALVGNQIHSVFSDSEVTYIMLSNGTQITIQGLVVVQPASPTPNVPAFPQHP